MKLRPFYDFLMVLGFICAPTLRAEATASELYTAAKARFPELGLPEGTPTLCVVTNPTDLQTALNTAASTPGDDLILLDGRTSQMWDGSTTISINGTAANGAIILLSQNPDNGTFTRPVTFNGFGLAISPQNTAPVYLAHFAITNSTTVAVATRTGGISAMGSGAIKGSCLSVVNSGTSTTGQFCYAGALYAASANVTLYNSTFANNATVQFGAITSISSTVSLVHCTLTGNRNATTGVTTGGTSAISQTNCLVTTEVYDITTSASTVPHILLDATSSAVNVATASTPLTLDVLGNPRIYGGIADLGAVEYTAAAAINTADDLVCLPSGPREVYLGWSVLPKASHYQLEQSSDNGTTWKDVTSETLWRTPQSTEGTITGWQSARHLAATPGTTAQYRLSYNVLGHNERIVETPLEVTTPALNIVPIHHSRPMAKQIIYLDFTGYIDDYLGNVSAARAGLEDASLTYVKTAPFEYNARFNDLTKPYPTTDAIYDIWRMVAEDFAAFDVDVTTEAPTYEALIKSSAEDMYYGKRVVIGYAAGTSKPWYVGGGAFSGGGTFGFQHDRPVYIFSVQSRQNIAAQITHEVSHTLGLAHDGGNIQFGDTFYSSNYYRGAELTPSGALNTSNYAQTALTWYPIMGGAPTPNTNGYYYDADDFINQWSRGNYSSATNTEDDFAILLGLCEGDGNAFTETPQYAANTRNISLIADDAGDTLDAAQTCASATFSQTGVIGKHLSADRQTTLNDVDCFKISTRTSGDLTLKVVPNYLGLTEGASLDAKVELLDHNGTLLKTASEPIWEANETFFPDIRNAEIVATLPVAGTYYIRVSGTVHPVTSTSISADGSASPEKPWYFNDAENDGSIGPYTLTSTFVTRDVLFPKPFVSDTTDFTDEAKARILAVTNGVIPTSITVNDGKNTPFTAAALSDILNLFSNCCQWDATTGLLSINYRFDVSNITVTNTAITLTVAISGETPITFTEYATFEKVNIQTNEITPLTADAIEGESEKTFTFPIENSTQLFSIRVKVKESTP